MLTQKQTELIERIEASSFLGARSFALNVRKQGFMTPAQYIALCNMHNSILPYSSKLRTRTKNDGWDHDDLFEGWDGY